MNRKENIVWGLIMLGLLYLTASITFSAYDAQIEEIYEPVCRNQFGHRVECVQSGEDDE